MVIESEPLQRLIRFLASAPTATPSRTELSEGLGLEGDDLDDLLDHAVRAGVVETWEECPDGPSVVLASAVAQALGLELVEIRPTRETAGSLFLARWERSGRVAKRQAMKRHAGVQASHKEVSLDAVENGRVFRSNMLQRPGGAVSGLQPARMPRPTHFFGFDQPWPIQPRNGACGACGNRKMDPEAFCLWCERSGFDGVIPTDIRRQVRASSVVVPLKLKPKCGTATARGAKKGRQLSGGTGPASGLASRN